MCYHISKHLKAYQQIILHCMAYFQLSSSSLDVILTLLYYAATSVTSQLTHKHKINTSPQLHVYLPCM